MEFFELLAITDSKQQIDIINIYEKVVESNSCIYFWECNVFYDELIKGIEVKNNKLLVRLNII